MRSQGTPVVDVERHARPGRRRRRRAPLVLATVLVLLVAAYAAATWYVGDRVPRGTTVAGVAIGGLPAAEARERLESALGDAVSAPIPVVLGENETTIDPAEAAFTFDAAATVDELTGFSFDPRSLLRHLTGGREHVPVTTVDRDALTAALERVDGVVGVAPVEGAIALVDGAAEVTEPVPGTAVDVPAAVDLLAEDWLTGPHPVPLPSTEVPPVVGPEAVEAARTDLAAPLTGAPVSVLVDDRLVELTPADLTSAAAIVPDGPELVLELDGEALVALLTERDPELAAPGRDAAIVLQGGVPTVVPSTTGLGLDVEEVTAAVRAAALSPSDRTAEVSRIVVEPEFTTAEAEALGVTQVVSTFSTPLFHDPVRTQNLVTGTREISGTLVRPGETFSLIEALGPITAERGFAASGVVVDGLETTGMGGGLSQLSTTTFNAAYFAGMELVEFQPHSHHYARYPEGREATLFTPHVDLKWRNTTEYGALVEAWVADNQVHVRLWGTPYFDVESQTGERYNITQPTTVYNSGPNCVANSSPDPGFTVQVTRTVLREGTQVDQRTYTTTYRPWDRVVCGSAPG
ncbi:VanW family protein [Georgenia faecalis]|uniref:VanW family protein n=1 Tax=Georgenia faecalis TaxID=2483799 RepID=UPI000FD9E130|nr:VanW family protein [Georgenia faecalis]